MPSISSLYSDKEIISEVDQHLQGITHYSDQQKNILGKRYKQINMWGLKNYQKNPKKNMDPFLKSIDDMIVSVGAPVELPDFPNLSPATAKIYGLLFRHLPRFRELAGEKELRRNIFVKQDPIQLKDGKDLFQDILNEVIAAVESSSDKTTNLAMEALIGNILALYTFLKPEKGETLKVPILVNGDWKIETYTVNPIELTPGWMGSPVVAFGLTPSGNSPPLLLFKGTSYPTDQGFFLQILTDVNPFRTIGAYLFNLGKKNIKKWLVEEEKKTGNKARLFGTSLGGALCEHTVIHFSDHVEKVYAFNCPALLSYELKNWNKKYKNGHMPEVNIYCQDNDFVGKIGLEWGKGWNIYKVFGPLKSPNPLLAHIRCFFADAKMLMLKINPKTDSKTAERWLITCLKQLFSVPLFMMILLFWLVKLGVQKTAEMIKSCIK